MRRRIVAGNWKMNGDLAFVNQFALDLKSQLAKPEGVDVVIAPPAPYIVPLVSALDSSDIGAAGQNLAAQSNGAFTGEMSAEMLADIGCDYVIVGHSERRTLFGETDEVVVAKVAKALDASLQAIVCVGETLEERESGNAESVVKSQVDAVLNVFDVEQLANVIIAYEPVWAIGTGKTASPAQAQAMHEAIRGVVRSKDESLAENMTILYGGSVNAANAEELFINADIDGGLIGGASLKVPDFVEICEALGRSLKG